MTIDYKAVGQRIRSLRKLRNVTQESLAEQVDISNPHLSNIERGVTKVSLPTLVLIANKLHTTVDQLLCDSLPEAKTVYVKEVRDILNDCNEKELRILSDTLKSLKSSLHTVYHGSENQENPGKIE